MGYGSRYRLVHISQTDVLLYERRSEEIILYIAKYWRLYVESPAAVKTPIAY